MNDRAALVANAADSRQVKNAGRKEKDRRSRELADIATVVASIEGRRFLWRLMAFCGYMENPTHSRGDMTHQNIGKGDVARFLISEIGETPKGIEAWLLMQREAWLAARSEQVEAEAIRTASAVQRTGTED